MARQPVAAGRPLEQQPPETVGLEARLRERGSELGSEVRSRGFAYGVTVHAPGCELSDNAFSVEPGGRREVAVRPREPGASPPDMSLTALNLAGRVGVVTEVAA